VPVYQPCHLRFSVLKHSFHLYTCAIWTAMAFAVSATTSSTLVITTEHCLEFVQVEHTVPIPIKF